MMRKIVLLFILIINCFVAQAQGFLTITPAAERMDEYAPLLKDKRVGLLMNQASIVGSKLLVDTLLGRNVNVVKIFVPEHGLRGKADAGAHVNSGKDERTGLPIISLYGNNKKPKSEQLKDIDILVYDLQDVGTRFYTYISTLQYAMEACAENGKTLMVLDRPNPNGHYVDGPVLEQSEKSFVGMQPIPIVYGMTAGEYAKMLAGEKWITGADKLKLTVIPCEHYDHSLYYTLPVAPSPNLRSMTAIYLYPSLCLFEGTVVSVGRGTNAPFEQFGHPDFFNKGEDFFIPQSVEGATNPPFKNTKCYGVHIANDPVEALKAVNNQFRLKWLIMAYNWYPYKDKFFNNFFDNLAGTDELKQQIAKGMTEEQIRATWQEDLDKFKSIRKKYLLYKDFQ